MYKSLICKRYFIIVFLTISCTLCFLTPASGYHNTRPDHVVKNHISPPPQKAELIHNDPPKMDERSIHQTDVGSRGIDDQETASDSSEVKDPHSENLRIPRAYPSKHYPSVETNSFDEDDIETVEHSVQLSVDERDPEEGSEFDDREASFTDEEPTRESTNEARFQESGESNDEIRGKISDSHLITTPERQNIDRSNPKGHRGVDLTRHTDRSGFHTVSNPQGVHQPGVATNDETESILSHNFHHSGNMAMNSPKRSEQLARDSTTHQDNRIPRYTGITGREQERIANPASMFNTYDSLNQIETSDEMRVPTNFENNRRMTGFDSTPRISQDRQGGMNENHNPFDKHPGALDLPADAEVSMKGAGWTTFDVPMEQEGGNEFQFSPLEDRHTSESLNSEYRKYFGELDDSIPFEMPELHVNCWLQSMMATTWGFSPSCNADGSYGPKQCHEKRCWCVDSNGQKIRHHGGKDDDGFYFGLQGLTLYCAEN